MIRRLVEANYFAHQAAPTPEQLNFWLHELRTPELLRDIVQAHPIPAKVAAASRNLIHHAISGESHSLELALENEQREEKLQDQAYWRPLKQELERLRQQ